MRHGKLPFSPSDNQVPLPVVYKGEYRCGQSNSALMLLP